MKHLKLSKKIIALCLSIFVSAGGITGYNLHKVKADNNDVKNKVDNTAPTASFGLSKKKKADIVFTTGGDNTFDTNSFNNKVNAYVKNRLINSGVNTSIGTIETSGQNLQSSFTWKQDVSSSIGQISFQNNGSKIQMYGNTCNPGFNKIYNINNDTDISKQEISFSYNINFGDSFDGAGVLIGTSVNKGLMNGYALFVHHTFINVPYYTTGMATLYKITNWSSSNNQDMQTSTNAQRVGSVNMGISGSFKLTITKESVVIQKSGIEIGNIKLPEHYGWGVGFFSDHYAHGCDQIGQFALDNLQIQTTKGKSFSDVLKEPTWRDNTHKFVVNLSEDALKSITASSKDYPTTLSTMLSNKEYFLAVMNSADKSTVNKFIAQNDGHGAYIDNNNLDTALNAVTDYILKVLNEEQDNSNIFLVGDELTYNEKYSDYEVDKKKDELWSYVQDSKHLNYDNDFVKCSQTGDLPLDNNLGIAAFATGQWVHNKVTKFDKPGKYKVSLKVQDNPTATDSNPSGDLNFNDYNKWSSDDNSIIINVNRKPTAVFTAYAIANASTGKFDVAVKDEDKSYDIDHQNTDGTRKGIVNKKFQWKEVTNGITDTWHDGKLPSPQASNKDFLVKLSVQDLEGQWGDDLVKYVTTKNENLPPVAQFTENETEMPVDQLNNNASIGKDVIFSDQSYDPNGDKIRETWTVKDSGGNVIYSSSTMPTANVFIGKPLGTYTITLVCDDGPTPKVGVPLTSDPYTLQLKLVPINHKPIAHFEVDNTFKEPEKIKITEDSSDPDGDTIDDRIWIITDSSGNVVNQSENKIPDLTSLDGTYTLTLKVKDKPKIPPELWSDPYSQQITVESLKFTGNLYPNPAKQGQQITFDLNTIGNAKYLRIYLPNDIISKDIRGTTLPIVKTITEEYTHNEKINYILPINTPLTLDNNGNRIRTPYEIPVNAQKENGASKSITLYLDVKGNVLDGIKTEIIGTGQDRNK